MAEREEVQKIIDENKQVQQRARELNHRAGENVFEVMSQEQIKLWLMERLNGARSIWEIDSVEALRFPSLDEELIQLVLSENPDTLRVLDSEFPVEYRGTSMPRVTLRKENGVDRWQELPDQGVKLPSGRPVEVVLSFDYYTSWASSSIPKLKEKVRSHLNQTQWENWRERPAILAPNFDIENAALPEITEIIYGQCVITGEPLKAFGTLQAHRGWYSSDPVRWGAVWFRTREEVDSYHTKAQAEFEKELTKAREKREQEGAQKEAQAAKEQLRAYQSHKDWYSSVEYSLRCRVNDRAGAYYLPSAVAELKQWTIETKALVAEAEQAIAEIQRKREEEEAAKLAEERRKAESVAQMGEILAKHYPTCPICGQEVNWQELSPAEAADEKRGNEGLVICSCFDSNEARQVEEALDHGWGEEENTVYFSRAGRNAISLRRSRIGAETVAEFLAFHKYGYWNFVMVVYPDALGAEGEWKTEQLWREPSELELKLIELRRLRDTYDDDVARAEADVADGYSRKLRFQKGVNAKTKEEQWESGSNRSGLKFILDRRTTFSIESGCWYYCHDRKTLVDLPHIKIILVEAYLPAGRNIDAEIAALEAKIAGGENEKPAIEKAPEAKSERESLTSDALAESLAALKAKFGK